MIKDVRIADIWKHKCSSSVPVFMHSYSTDSHRRTASSINDMPPKSSAVDWVALQPKILRLLSEDKTQKDVVEEISRDGLGITSVAWTCSYSLLKAKTLPRKSQLEYQLKLWGRRTNLTEKAWVYVGHRRQKRARNKKKSAIYHNGALIPDAKVIKEIRRHVRPTLLPEPGGKFNP